MKRTYLALLAGLLAGALLLSGCGVGDLLGRFGTGSESRADTVVTPAETETGAISRREMVEEAFEQMQELCWDEAYLTVSGEPRVADAVRSWRQATPDLNGYAWRLDPEKLGDVYLREVEETSGPLSEAGRNRFRQQIASTAWASLCSMSGSEAIAAASITANSASFPEPGCTEESWIWILPSLDDSGLYYYVVISASPYGFVTVSTWFLPLNGTPDSIFGENYGESANEIGMEYLPFEP